MDINSVCIVVVFNHRFEGNITKLKKIYGDRFSKVVFLMPFYTGADPNVISVYESSYQFHGFFIQALDKLLDTGCSSFLFIADDMILNPACNESNIFSMFHFEDKLVGVLNVDMLNDDKRFAWNHARYSSRPFFSKATNWKDNLPCYEKAMELFRDFYGRPYPEEYGDGFYAPIGEETPEELLVAKNDFLRLNRGDRIPYPLARGYSDILFVKREIMKPLFHTMGVFSAMNLFVEIAIPTAIVLTVPRTKVSIFSEHRDCRYYCMWTDVDKQAFARKYGKKYNSLIGSWDTKWLFVHPVKLSEWTV